ncbi:sugar ABC transporter ATP-binding protein [Clostridium sp. SYSU_GA19001]|uniref:sugar ABC transporter ATP-binding protein n=1 Tax=Clostridium caldaquaticum TaxID=2940653 RepID=UPI00207796D7|nr:sugar ABC transporter ATP-binding protein [Clostridium caldaquaticum]MCM8710015.1 sugar ABC transporter ATP-binding protein [Clostridium caldaquaticum]
MNRGEVFLKISNVSKTFPGVKALDNMQLEIVPGEVHALIGENGAGKSTLIKILSGIYQPDEGAEIYIEGEKTEITNSLVSVRKGIAVIYQDFSLFPNLTVTENIAISQQIEKSTKKLNWAEMRKIAKKAIERIGVDIDLDIQVGKLSVAKQQLVAIARSLVYDAKMIIMDEPTSALSKGEVEGLFKIVRSLQEKGIAVIFVSHKLEELFEIAQRFTVMRDGKYVGTYKTEELDQDKLIALMVGRKIELKKYEKTKIGNTVLEVKNLSKKGNFKDVSFTLKEGEILGFTGLVGAGRTEVMQALFGITTPEEGQIFINGKEVKITSTEDAVKNGLAFVPESRLTEGLVMRQSVADNISLSILEKLVNRFNIIDMKKKKNIDEGWISRLKIKPGIPDMDVQKLSGGNQQRVVVAKWLATDPKILIIDEPTNGIDVGAKEEIHRLLKELAAKGMAIIMISSELPEILALSDRIMVMRRGRIVAEFDGDTATQEKIMNKAVLNAG